jgi:hypothetical protein
MSQLTDPIGRMGVQNPEFLYDVSDGGTNLYNTLTDMFTAFSDNSISRFKYVENMANSAIASITHNFGLAASELEVVVFESGAPLNKQQRDGLYTITQVNTNEIQIQNISGGARSPSFVVFGVSSFVLSGKLKGGLTTTDNTPTNLITLPIAEGKRVAVNIMVSAVTSSTDNVYFISGSARNIAGTVTFTAVRNDGAEGDSALAVSVEGSGANLVAKVTGKAATTIQWHGTLESNLY